MSGPLQLALFGQEALANPTPALAPVPSKKPRSDVTAGTKDWWKEPDVETRIKIELFVAYFLAWQNIIRNQMRRTGRETDPLVYMDVCAGRGRYKNGEAATPVRIVQAILADPDLRQRVLIVLNEKQRGTWRVLYESIMALPGIDGLRHAPIIDNADASAVVPAYLARWRGMAKCGIIDPWGYNILSPDLITATLDGWGSDCLFFFNNRRIHAGLTNPEVENAINTLFGRRRADKLRALSDTLRTQDMDDAITAMMDAALAERNIHATRFPFANENGNGYSHSIWLASKNPKACQVMRRIMNKKSTATQSGPQALGFNPAHLTDGWQAQLALIPAPETPWRENLMRDLRMRYSGDPISTRELIVKHHRYTNYRDETYKSVITEMEEAGLVTCNPPAHLRRKRNGVVMLGDDVVLHFRPLERSC